MTTVSFPSLCGSIAVAPSPTAVGLLDETEEQRESREFYTAHGASVLLAIKATIARNAAQP